MQLVLSIPSRQQQPSDTNSHTTNASLHTCPWQTYRQLVPIPLVEKPVRSHPQHTHITRHIRFRLTKRWIRILLLGGWEKTPFHHSFHLSRRVWLWQARWRMRILSPLWWRIGRGKEMKKTRRRRSRRRPRRGSFISTLHRSRGRQIFLIIVKRWMSEPN